MLQWATALQRDCQSAALPLLCHPISMCLTRLLQMQLHGGRLRHVTRGRQQLALSPQAAEARAGVGDWIAGSECRDAEPDSGTCSCTPRAVILTTMLGGNWCQCPVEALKVVIDKTRSALL
ncbi:hypothetical protein M3J09_000604 [Ascochyta lentis]